MRTNPIGKISKLSKRWWAIAAIAVLTTILLTFLSASGGSAIARGSSYSRAPSGYGAWYAFMEKRGTNIQRWQRSLPDLFDRKSTTLVRVLSGLGSEGIAITKLERDWVALGNRLVILGIRTPATEAAFTKTLESKAGVVSIDTTRRFSRNPNPAIRDSDKSVLRPGHEQLLGDEFGAVVVSQSEGAGKLVLASTPHLAANAYQDAIGNYEFLAQLVTEGGNSAIVDEYIHGYKDRDLIAKEGKKDWLGYLFGTPLLPAIFQMAIVLLVLIVSLNRRFGVPVVPKSRSIDNSTAYMQAMATVLRKAESSEFVVETIAKAEQLRIQQALGLGGQTLVDHKAIANAWTQQTRRPASEILSVLQFSDRPRKVNESELKTWLTNIQIVHNYLP
jgi:hypothetical protein